MHRQPDIAGLPGKRELSVYIHIPFCVKKCLYCDFLSFPETYWKHPYPGGAKTDVIAGAKSVREQYVKALCRELGEAASGFKGHIVKTIFMGGGTPSLLSYSELSDILGTVYGSYSVDNDAEISIEANPGTLTEEFLKECLIGGVNRVSLGLQSADDLELKRLGRIHSFSEFLASYELCRESGIENINVDLMSALPGQRLGDWESTLKKTLDLEPSHISAYSLILEEGTPLYDMYSGRGEGASCKESQPDDLGGDLKEPGESLPELPTEDEDREMYLLTKSMLLEHGYERYEISNYARRGFRCRHNMTYWTRGDYAGFGLGASSMVGNIRYKNTDDMGEYLRKLEWQQEKSEFPARCEATILTKNEQMEETMFLGLRLTDGVDLDLFQKTFDADAMDIYGSVIDKYRRAGLLELTNCGGRRLRLTDRGFDVCNTVMADFLLD